MVLISVDWMSRSLEFTSEIHPSGASLLTSRDSEQESICSFGGVGPGDKPMGEERTG